MSFDRKIGFTGVLLAVLFAAGLPVAAAPAGAESSRRSLGSLSIEAESFNQTRRRRAVRTHTYRRGPYYGYRNYGQYRRTQVGNRRYRLVKRYYWDDGRRRVRYVRVYY